MFLVVKKFCAGSYLPEEEDERYLAFIMIEAGSGKTVHLIKTGLKFSLFQVSIKSLQFARTLYLRMRSGLVRMRSGLVG